MSLKIEELKVGTGAEAKKGNTVSVHYVGTLTTGSTARAIATRRSTFCWAQARSFKGGIKAWPA